MAVSQSQLTVPSNGTPVVILGGGVVNSNQITVRNTGSVALLVGPRLTLGSPSGFGAVTVQTGGTFASGATVFWQITATNALGETTPSLETTATFSYLTNTGSATLTWSQVSGATGYKVYRSTSSGGEVTTPALVTTIGSGATVTYTDTNSSVSSGAVPSANTAYLPVLFPLAANAQLSWMTSPDDFMLAVVASNGTPGQITTLGTG